MKESERLNLRKMNGCKTGTTSQRKITGVLYSSYINAGTSCLVFSMFTMSKVYYVFFMMGLL